MNAVSTSVRKGRKSKGFTLVEILIVVIILGILAAIVIPQFTSATTDARNNSASSLQSTLRSQIQLYRLQHGDQLPAGLNGNAGVVAGATAWNEMLSQTTDTNGNTVGPYVQSLPLNPLTGSSDVAIVTTDTDASADVGFVINKTTGRFWATGGLTNGAVDKKKRLTN